MSLYSRACVVLFLLGITACGFEPVYAPTTPSAEFRNAIVLPDPTDQDEFILVPELEKHLGQVRTEKFQLDWELDTATRTSAVSAEQETLRQEVIGRLQYTLTDNTTGEVIKRGTVRGITGYSPTLVSAVARTNELDARQRLMRILANRLSQQIMVQP